MLETPRRPALKRDSSPYGDEEAGFPSFAPTPLRKKTMSWSDRLEEVVLVTDSRDRRCGLQLNACTASWAFVSGGFLILMIVLFCTDIYSIAP